jgi:hypothetical protein
MLTLIFRPYAMTMLFARTIPAEIWSNLAQWLQRSLNVKTYDVSRTNDGHQVMAEDFMAFGHVSWKVIYNCFTRSHTLTAATRQWLVQYIFWDFMWKFRWANFCLLCKLGSPSWIEDGAVRHNFERGPPKYHPSQFWFKLAKWFQRIWYA